MDGLASADVLDTIGKTTQSHYEGEHAMLECGHAPTPNAGCGTGYSIDDAGVKSCYPCSDRLEIRAMLRAAAEDGYGAKYAGYLSQDEKEGFKVTTWTGGSLGLKVQEISKTSAGFSGERWYFRAVDPVGRVWSGSAGGMGMIARFRWVRN